MSAGALIGPYGSGGSKLTQDDGDHSTPAGAPREVTVRFTESTCEAAWLIRLTIWFSSVPVPAP